MCVLRTRPGSSSSRRCFRPRSGCPTQRTSPPARCSSQPEGERDYPIVGFTYVMLYKGGYETGRADAVEELLQWCLTEGQNDMRGVGLRPPAAERAAEAIDALNKVGS